eukprot:TRINITY_DN57583_c0_g1_i1.p1 TRINITY_DN57583_c0_g1~~TRINITY_DN57583_c0_g1_i1.p1  ORF type:complete len:561 (+),score=56.93 TRINITY_DN57583_c0_g1_i1:197-1879(+)
MSAGESCRLFRAWLRLWAVNCLLDVQQANVYFESAAWRLAVLLLALLALCKPSATSLTLAMVARTLARFAKMPYIWDGDYWSIFLDTVFCSYLWKAVCSGAGPDVAVMSAAPVVRMLLAMFYFAAGFWKVNTSFLSAQTSCGSIFTATWLVQLWPASWGPIPPLAARMAVYLGPWLTVTGECATGLVLSLPNKACQHLGLLAMLLLHLGISFAAYPNGIANFSCTAATRYFFVAPAGTAATLDDILTLPRSPTAYLLRATAVAILAFAWQYAEITGPQRLGATYFAALVVLYCGALCAEWNGNASAATRRNSLGPFGWMYVAFVAFFVFGAQILGLVDVSAPASPFSSIRLHGGSNHLLLPTGLLQRWSDEGSLRILGAAANSFGGGVVRIEYTDSAYLNGLYPGESTAELPPEVVRVLRDGGHIGRQYAPTPRRVLGPEVRALLPRWNVGDGPFPRYTVPAQELSRMLFEARAMGENFSITYTHLPGTLGDETWRASALGRKIMCNISSIGERCSSADGGALATGVPQLPTLDLVARKTRVFFPYPILPDAGGELPCID